MATKCPKCHSENPETVKFCGECGTPIHPDEKAFISFTKTVRTPTKKLISGNILADKYRIIEELGRGGMGVVYKAEDLKLKRFVALKFLPLEMMIEPEARARFILEAQAAAALSHPNICTIYEVSEAEDKPFIAMEYIDGKSLREKLKTGPFKDDEVLGIAIQVAEGLEEAHKKGIIHRDIKSANIMVTEKGQAKIMDFGLAKLRGGTSLTQAGATLGTVAYMSPEQARGEKVDQRTDLWSLGVVLYEILTGDLPFRGEREASILYSIVHEEPKPLKDRKPPIPSEMEQIIYRAFRKDPESRYQSASEVLKDLRRYQEILRAAEAGVFNLRSFLKRARQPKTAIPAALVFMAVAALAVWFFAHQAKIRWARDVLLPKIGQLIEVGIEDRIEAGKLALEAEKYLSHDPKLAEYLSKATIPMSIDTEPPGAKIYLKKYTAPESEWQYLGVSPIENIRLPIGIFRWKMEKEGYETVLAVSPTFLPEWAQPQLYTAGKIARTLDKKGSLPPGMLRVKGGPPLHEVEGGFFEINIDGIGEIGDFFIDQYEVTNKQFKEFVDKGGYRNQRYWKQKFIKDGKASTWQDAVKQFVDQTGQPGPSTWQGGDYPKGQDDYPVSGVSWYEAAAYAEFVGKSLPTASHWGIARGVHTPFIQSVNYLNLLSPLSNFKGEGPAPVGRNPGITSYGAYDMAGNVREWCWNAAPKGRVIRGGSWNDVPYLFAYWSQASPFERSPENGFRCALYPEPEKIPEQVFDPGHVTATQAEDYYKEKPVPDSIFQIYREQFSYDRIPLNARVEWRNEGAKDWVQEKISFDAAYENERMMAYVFLPKGSSLPYQTVIHFSGNAEYQRSSKNLDQFWDFENSLSFIIKSGRAVLFPVYKGTFERGSDALIRILDGDPSTRQNTEILIKVVKDLKRSIDYLETRPEIDCQRLAYTGWSWGAWFGPIILAVEDRIKTSILESGDFFPGLRPELKQINYLPRVKIPTLMLNGRYDLIYPNQPNVKLMFELLGTPKEQKELIIYESGHIVPRNELIKETLRWLDKYLGPVKK